MVLEQKYSQGIEWINLWNCHRLCDSLGICMEKLERIILNQVSEEVTPTNGVSIEFGAYIWINNVYVDGDFWFHKKW
ncbi:hypothetical protein RchiOBHm_Chr4g0387061 [Rosa chinensis]|uniref:Uncharacterized protein n=1 Tax=Rosa chinensis TaxID=74649 RepID=A0A2P6QPC9_ROSCH|nr:hypothetical protein RchiOBHm_Chr4g0387061 [Rosa chinensis]